MDIWILSEEVDQGDDYCKEVYICWWKDKPTVEQLLIQLNSPTDQRTVWNIVQLERREQGRVGDKYYYLTQLIEGTSTK